MVGALITRFPGQVFFGICPFTNSTLFPHTSTGLILAAIVYANAFRLHFHSYCLHVSVASGHKQWFSGPCSTLSLYIRKDINPC